ncbi:hypothetical protein [Parasitella parasitica]|uniref:CCR4-Not complex component Not1 C-terminal domain-containing protein n=1 Tax=Parasitella parasitica TaxID=35722 RepID=A0A0B7NW17_9FUNG|nr:hypothetical protein [Parasitella parasitica]
MSPSTPAIPPNNDSKMKLYEMFAQKQIAPPPNLAHPGIASSSSSNNLFNFLGFQQSSDLFTTKVEQMLIELDRLLKKSGNLPFSLLPPHHDIILVMRQIPLLINQSAQPTLLRSVVESVIYQLYQCNTGLSVEVYCRFLQTLLELSPSISKETLNWLLYSEDERKNDVWVITSLIKYGLIPLEDYDVKLSKQLNHQPTDNQIEFITEMLQNCLLTMNPITSIEEHVLVINALMKLKSPKLYLPLLFAADKESTTQMGQTICFKLISAHFSFLNQLLRHRSSRRLTQSEKAFYQGTLRFLVVMLHDYPEFLCRHYLSLIQLLPVACVQLRNVILSSFPKTMILPDPFTTTLGYMANNSTEPNLHIQQDYSDTIALLSSYLKGSTKSIGRQIISHLIDQRQQLDNKKLQQLVFYFGSHTTLDTGKSLSENPAVQIFKYLLAHMEHNQDRYLVINAIVDHLRYPNTHTYFFSMTILHLFASQPEYIKELVIRVLLERLIVNRPHPWGLLTTFIQLIKEPMFTEHKFIKESMAHSSDIKRLFDNVLK